MTPNKIQYLNADGKMTVERVRRMDGRDYITASGKIVSPTRVMGVDDSEPRRGRIRIVATTTYIVRVGSVQEGPGFTDRAEAVAYANDYRKDHGYPKPRRVK